MFAVAGPRLWNSLPTAIRNISLTIHTFGKHLKTLFFLVERGRGAFVTFMISLRRIQMFLLTYFLLTYVRKFGGFEFRGFSVQTVVACVCAQCPEDGHSIGI